MDATLWMFQWYDVCAYQVSSTLTLDELDTDNGVPICLVAGGRIVWGAAALDEAIELRETAIATRERLIEERSRPWPPVPLTREHHTAGEHLGLYRDQLVKLLAIRTGVEG